MSRETDSQGDMLKLQLEHDWKMRTVDRLHEFIVQGAKGLAVLNGGAVVAMLAFVQSLVDKKVYVAFKPYALAALILFLIGAFLSTIAFFFQHSYVTHAFQGLGCQKVWRRVVWGILIASAACAFVGGGLVAGGISVAV